jgi:two-component system, NtrC family, response regulator AtoC
LNVIAIHLPALRDRMDDIPLLVEHFVQKHRFTPGSEPARLSQGAMNALMEYDWPGNVRELENLIERATVLAQGGVITEQHVSFYGADNRRLVDVGERLRRGTTIEDLLHDIERQAFSEALSQTDGDRLAAASMLGLRLQEFNKRSANLEV